MELWACTIESDNNDRALLGIFSTKEKAETQAQIFMQGFGDLFELTKTVDESVSDEVLCYKAKRTDEQFLAYIEKYHLNELSY